MAERQGMCVPAMPGNRTGSSWQSSEGALLVRYSAVRTLLPWNPSRAILPFLLQQAAVTLPVSPWLLAPSAAAATAPEDLPVTEPWKEALAQCRVDHRRKELDAADVAKRYAPSGDHVSSDVAARSA